MRTMTPVATVRPGFAGLALALLTCMTGCADLHGYIEERWEAAKTAEPIEHSFARNVASVRSSLTDSSGPVTLSGTYGGYDGQCHRVALTWVQYGHTRQYRVCKDRVAEASGATPELPDSKDITPMRDSLVRAAWASGRTERAMLDGYHLEAVPVGPPDGNGCRQVDDRVSYGASIVDIRRVRVCN